eukprot:4439891-Prymnesium_polylepis.1
MAALPQNISVWRQRKKAKSARQQQIDAENARLATRLSHAKPTVSRTEWTRHADKFVRPEPHQRVVRMSAAASESTIAPSAHAQPTGPKPRKKDVPTSLVTCLPESSRTAPESCTTTDYGAVPWMAGSGSYHAFHAIPAPQGAYDTCRQEEHGSDEVEEALPDPVEATQPDEWHPDLDDGVAEDVPMEEDLPSES